MKAILILILIWAAAAFIYSKVKKVGFVHAMINIPLIVFRYLLKESASSSRRMANDLHGKRQYEAEQKMRDNCAAAESFADMAAAAKDTVDSKFNKDE